ncbi:MAG: lipid-A-disaccharide synthase N-terminal domain-containing protein [Candidatus Omnitrophica bacterium]|nr:lipid-A-disaccharide synthase N-terminal domain-containing protein [Candidatus Omnitrophota bacterium]
MLNVWLIVGLAGQLLFAARFIVQWICSERRGESYIPIVFWYLSLAGGVILLVYAISRRDPVFILGQTGGVFVYMRNLHLIHAKQKEGA